jgi:hypothetical protein
MIISFLTVFNPLIVTAEPCDIMQSGFSYSISEIPGSRPGYDNVYSGINLTTFQMTRPWTRRYSISSKASKFRPDYTESHSRTPPWEPQNSHTTLTSSFKIQGQFPLNFFPGYYLCVCVCVCVCGVVWCGVVCVCVRAASSRPLAAQKRCSCRKLSLHNSPTPGCWLCSLQNVISNLCCRTVDKEKRFIQGM